MKNKKSNRIVPKKKISSCAQCPNLVNALGFYCNLLCNNVSLIGNIPENCPLEKAVSE